MSKILRVGIYLRLSDEDRDKFNKNDDSESIKNQRNLLISEINKRNNFILIDEYCDEDLSGAGTYRPEFERLIRDCECGKLDVVLCKSQSRFSRDMEIIERYIHNKFLEWGIRFIGLSDNADTDNIGNKKARQINGLVNEWYLEDVSNNIRSAFRAKMNQGEFISPFACYGYMVSEIDNNKLVVDDDVSVVVRDIFNLYLSGLGYGRIARYLNEKNIPSPSLYKYYKGIKLHVVSNKKREDIKWSSNAVKSILSNEIYIGNLVQGKRTTISYKNHKIKNRDKNEWIRCEGVHDAIIDKEIFDRVQVLMKERTRCCKKSGNVHIFSGIVYCLVCGKKMRKKNSGKYEYLVCSSEIDGDGRCNNKYSIRYDILEKLVLEKINDLILKLMDVDLLRSYFDSRNVFCNDDNGLCFLDSDINSINVDVDNDKKISKLLENKKILNDKINDENEYLKFLYNDRVQGIISVDQFRYLILEYNKCIDRYRNDMVRLDNEIKKIENERNVNVDDFVRVFSLGFNKLDKFIVDEFILRIYVGGIDLENNIRDIRIEWNF